MSDQFERELADWGPKALANGRTATLAEAESYTRRIATTHYENFTVVSWLLPKHLRSHFHNVYAYCRWSDDLGDEVGDRERAEQLLNWWQTELEDCYRGQTRHPVFVALAETIREFEIPMEPFADLLSAFRQDQHLLQYETFEQLRDYCRCSADPVGRLVLYLGREHSEENVALSDHVCTGLQLANFWQDVDRDWDIGRRYLPLESLERFGYSQEEFEHRETNPAFLKLMEFEVDRARTFLTNGLPLVNRLPGRLQVDIELFIRGGLKILERIEAIGYRVWDTRPVVTKADAVRMLAGCVIRATGRRFWPRRSIATHEHTPG